VLLVWLRVWTVVLGVLGREISILGEVAVILIRGLGSELATTVQVQVLAADLERRVFLGM
jgi:hypothetical protein